MAICLCFVLSVSPDREGWWNGLGRSRFLFLTQRLAVPLHWVAGLASCFCFPAQPLPCELFPSLPSPIEPTLHHGLFHTAKPVIVDCVQCCCHVCHTPFLLLLLLRLNMYLLAFGFHREITVTFFLLLHDTVREGEM